MATLQHYIRRFREDEALSPEKRIPIDKQQFWWKENSVHSTGSSLSNLSHSYDYSVENTDKSSGGHGAVIDNELCMGVESEHTEEFVSLNAYTDYLIKACDDLLIRNQNIDDQMSEIPNEQSMNFVEDHGSPSEQPMHLVEDHESPSEQPIHLVEDHESPSEHPIHLVEDHESPSEHPIHLVEDHESPSEQPIHLVEDHESPSEQPIHLVEDHESPSEKSIKLNDDQVKQHMLNLERGRSVLEESLKFLKEGQELYPSLCDVDHSKVEEDNLQKQNQNRLDAEIQCTSSQGSANNNDINSSGVLDLGVVTVDEDEESISSHGPLTPLLPDPVPAKSEHLPVAFAPNFICTASNVVEPKPSEGADEGDEVSTCPMSTAAPSESNSMVSVGKSIEFYVSDEEDEDEILFESENSISNTTDNIDIACSVPAAMFSETELEAKCISNRSADCGENLSAGQGNISTTDPSIIMQPVSARESYQLFKNSFKKHKRK